MAREMKITEQAMEKYHIVRAKSWNPSEMGTTHYAFEFRDFAKLTEFYALLREIGLRPDGINYMTVYAK